VREDRRQVGAAGAAGTADRAADPRKKPYSHAAGILRLFPKGEIKALGRLLAVAVTGQVTAFPAVSHAPSSTRVVVACDLPCQRAGMKLSATREA
jgi:hypothetical protein